MIPKHNFPGFLLAIEGIDGAGKTTQAHSVQDYLQARKLPVLRTKEPTAGRWGRILRDSATTGRLSLEEEVDTFIKDRMEHVKQLINPALKNGQIVIVDRYYFSTAAYQGARGCDAKELIRRNEEFAPEPDLLIVLDLDPKEGLRRIKLRGDKANHFESIENLSRVRAIFQKIKKPYLYKLEATQAPDQLRDFIVRQFSRISAERVAHSNRSEREKLNAALQLFGGEPLTSD